MKRYSLWFTAPQQVEVREEKLAAPRAGEVRVQTLCSAISPGTEMLIYRDEFPHAMAVDETIGALAGTLAYPLRYGYSVVGRVVELGAGVEAQWQDRLVFSFQPHVSAFTAPLSDLHPLPEGIEPETAIFLPNMETAVNFMLDGAPLVGERMAVFGQGVVGLLTTALLARLPLAALSAFDCFPLRREWSLRLGAHTAADSDDGEHIRALDADLCYELTGSPATLDAAIAATGFGGRIVIGSWYGEKRHAVDLGGRFHRSRIRLIASQVSTLTPELLARWTKTRRLAVAWRLLAEIQPARLITHRFSLAEAARAYQLIDQSPAECLQVVFTYD
ncbi:MAG: zinc-dependent alcohol dehydrogenase [Anaerolineales bacterium]